jgi:hypothetical protein
MSTHFDHVEVGGELRRRSRRVESADTGDGGSGNQLIQITSSGFLPDNGRLGGPRLIDRQGGYPLSSLGGPVRLYRQPGPNILMVRTNPEARTQEAGGATEAILR